MREQANSAQDNPLKGRDLKVDLLKGFLVALMVVFHCASMVIARRPVLAPILNHLDFLHLAFLVTSGFVIGIHYIPLVESGNLPQIRSRVRWRGVRILFTFISINIGAYVTGILAIGQLREVFLTRGSALTRLLLFPDGNLYATEVLFHIGVFLLLISYTLRRDAAKLAFCSAIVCLPLSKFSSLFLTSSAGFVGVLLASGYRLFWVSKLDKRIGRQLAIFGVLLTGVLFLRSAKPEICPSWILAGILILSSAACTTVCFLFTILALPLFRVLRLDGVVMECGRYTLFAYVWQMILIRIVALVASRHNLDVFTEYCYSVVIVVVATGVSVLVLKRLRRQYGWINTVYKSALE